MCFQTIMHDINQCISDDNGDAAVDNMMRMMRMIFNETSKWTCIKKWALLFRPPCPWRWPPNIINLILFQHTGKKNHLSFSTLGLLFSFQYFDERIWLNARADSYIRKYASGWWEGKLCFYCFRDSNMACRRNGMHMHKSRYMVACIFHVVLLYNLKYI